MTSRVHLTTGSRVILGHHHVFRFNNPMEAKAKRESRRLAGNSMDASEATPGSAAAAAANGGHSMVWVWTKGGIVTGVLGRRRLITIFFPVWPLTRRLSPNGKRRRRSCV